MLEKIATDVRMEKAEFKEKIGALELRLGELQRKARDLGIPIIIVFEGWEASGKGTQINKLILSMDPRGYVVNFTKDPTEEEAFRPPLWRFWIKTPEKGRIAIFDRSWYHYLPGVGSVKIFRKKHLPQIYSGITSFEKLLVDDGTVIIKFFLHISRKEQKKRFKELDSDKATSWRISKDDWKLNSRYEELFEAYDSMIVNTGTEYAPWTVVEANDSRHATVKIFEAVIAAVEERIERQGACVPARTAGPPEKKAAAAPCSSVLDSVDLSQSMSKDEYSQKLDKCQEKLRELEYMIYRKRIPVVVLYEGWDAAGKGGNIRRLAQSMDPRGYEVVPVAAPNDVEKKHHYLWRFWQKIPKAGHIAVFDRTWYGRVLVERVEGFCSEDEWKRAYREINDMERHMADFGTVIVKFWLHIGKDEQLKRFKERQDIPYKNWKITEEDWRNRDKWDLYKAAVDEMILKTSTDHAPWTVVEANCKYYARIKALETVIKAIKKAL